MKEENVLCGVTLQIICIHIYIHIHTYVCIYTYVYMCVRVCIAEGPQGKETEQRTCMELAVLLIEVCVI